MYDLIIVGAGPAGATLARLLGIKYRILLLDRRRVVTDSRLQEKCCGGLLAPDAQGFLAQFGLGLPREVLVGPQLFSVRTIDLENNLERHYQRHYINIDRQKFDYWLMSLIPSDVTICLGSQFRLFREEKNRIIVNFIQQGKEHTESAKILVGADGAWSAVRRQLFPQYHPKMYIAVQEWFKTQSRLPFFTAIFDREISDYYSWTIPKGEEVLVGAALPYPGKTLAKFELLKNKLKAYGFSLSTPVKRNGAFIVRPRGMHDILLGQRQVALIGEAAGWISPSSAEGLSYAFASSLALARSLSQDIDNFQQRHHANTRSLRRNIGLKLLKVPFMYNTVLRKTIMSMGLRNIDLIDE